MNRLTSIGRFEQTVRQSRFIGVCGAVEDPEQARAFISDYGEPDCRHVCFAWKIADRIRFDDAGEPGGTAGRPLLAALEHYELDRAIVVVSRYFGGVKLGTGGLARAYGSTAMQALAAADHVPIIETVELNCHVPFDAAAQLHHLAEQYSAEASEPDWDEFGLNLRLTIARRTEKKFRRALTEATRAAAKIQRVPSES